MSHKLATHFISPLLIISAALTALPSLATIVEFQTSEGNFKVNLHDETTPATVANFLSYVNDGSYNDTVIHRTVSNFIVQGGGARFDGELAPVFLATKDPVRNEPVYSNIRGTIAMAKLGNNPDSATNQWFINLNNNSSNLDVQNSGFTVFGEIIDDGMSVVDSIAAVATCDIAPGQDAFDDLPMPAYDCGSGDTASIENYINISQIIIEDTSTTTASTLSPVKNTLINSPTNTPSDSSGGGGGSIGWLMLVVAGILSASRRVFKIS